ncbi:DUF1877 family protein [Streptomyces sp. NPDC000229]|uniref:DUF1877 family protein n=1 Tax=Streptomyces sp. NPDC000229 TaxID=3154247 RepID=UPI0033185967
MSIGEYRRVTAEEPERGRRDSDWTWNLVEDVREAEEATEPPASVARYCHTYTAWAPLDVLLRRVGFPVDVTHGEEELHGEGEVPGFFRYLPVQRVRCAAEAFSAMPYDRLIEGVDHGAVTDKGVGPFAGDSVKTLQWARHLYEGLVSFFERAARDGHAVLVWQQ